jgi:hypothetical protein
MERNDRLPLEDRPLPVEQSSADAGQSADPSAAEALRVATVTAEKALLREIKTYNKAGRPIMHIHEPRLRFETGEKLRVFPDELLTDGGVIYLRCADHPDLYLRKDDVAIAEA